ncbi:MULTISPECIES: hypothetical protein [Enterobacteriaceae]|uniref:hypothetical protein n=1 Tax=Enterobacteriaceae TaxID=543 RepID=UPI0007CA6142|nr:MULTISPECIES: hypothetical protein [Enterobacteriaceae]AUX97422.1 hypothetical protein C3F37_10870 [Salmonella enterica subsp. enterica serovar Senftenberg]QBY72294.1 hypothetical protein EIP71_11090 [Salmonella enterica subsp. enterica serovar Senftenberg]QBY81558.1 hypothetical protein EIO66_11090 [Salmonella enterica subsp. enterica serovar Senftenberg]QCC12096.1 hypothetical protein EIP70_11090 [Salmonella enterica subsp. enterica serovar Senftenberg]SAR82372.1 Uncharacterised protein [
MESKTKKLRMGWIQNLTENEKKIIDDFLEEAAKLKGKALNKKEKQTVKFIARDQVRSIRKEQKSKKQKKSKVDMEKKEDETINTISNNADEQGRLKILSANERDFINNAIYEEMKIKGRKLVKCEMKEVLKIARKKILNNRISFQIKKERDKERHAVVFEWKRPETFRR